MGPFPPPHGGISVHVQNVASLLERNIAKVKVLNVEPRAPRSDSYIKVSNGVDLGAALMTHAWDGWTIHAHINGHNPKSWIIALAAGLAGQNGNGGILTIHSGIAPHYLNTCSVAQRTVAQLACLQFSRIICVNDEIADTVRAEGIPPNRIETIPAFLPLTAPAVKMPQGIETWIESHTPILSTALFFRPEYGFEVLISCLKELVKRQPRLGCLVMGSGEERMAAEVLTKTEGLAECVRFLGDVDHEVCLALMARSRVFIRPSFRDGDSICVREAVSLGVPVVASNVGTRPAEAILFEPGNAEECVSQVEVALKGATSQGPVARPDTVERLLRLYSLTAGED